MKTTLNIIIAVLIFLIAVDIEKNSTAKIINYSNSICALVMLLIFGFIRYYYREFEKRLIERK